MIRQSYCPDCGPMPVSHAVERWNARLDYFFSFLTKAPEIIWQAVKPAVAWLRPGRLIPLSVKILAAAGVGPVLDTPDDKVNWRTRVLWEEAERRGIKMYEFRPFGLPREMFFATFGGDTRGFDGLPRARNAHESSINWMDDKGVILEKFRRAGIPVPRGGTAKNIMQAEKIFRAIGAPVIVKPNLGSRSRHTYLHVTDVASLRTAFAKAKELSPRVVVEEELPGFVFRATLVGGKIAGVMRREPPHIMGDGMHTIRELVAEENKNPKRHGPIFHELHLGPETETILKEQNLSFDAIPVRGRMVMLHPKVSRAFGASTTEFEISEVHPDNQKLFLHIADVLDDPIVGVDFMIEDIGKSWRDQKCGAIECNSLPFIDLHHYPLKGSAKNVAGMIWDLIFPTSKA